MTEDLNYKDVQRTYNRSKSLLLILLLTSFFSVNLKAQSYIMGTGSASNGSTLPTDVGFIYDAGGLAGNYSNNQDLRVTIEAGVDEEIKLTFGSFNLENSYDFLYVYDGNSTSSPQVAGSPFTGTTIPNAIFSSSGYLTVRYTTDFSRVRSGFELAYKMVPGATLGNTQLTWATAGLGSETVINGSASAGGPPSTITDQLTGCPAAGSKTSFDVDITFTETQGNVFDAIRTSTNGQYGQPYLTTYMDNFDNLAAPNTAYNPGDEVTLEFDFEYPVQIVDFRVDDIDASDISNPPSGSNSFQDQVEFIGLGIGGDSIPVSLSVVKPGRITIDGNKATADWVAGVNRDIQPDSLRSMVNVSVIKNVKKFVLKYQAGPDDSNPAQQAIRIGRITIGCPVLLNLSGRVFNDLDGLDDNTVDGTGISSPDGTQLYANLIDSISGTVIKTVAIGTNGIYSFSDVPGEITYYVQVSSNQGVVDSPAPLENLPIGWVATGENEGLTAGNDGLVDQRLKVVLAAADKINLNFGIKELKVAIGDRVWQDLNGNGVQDSGEDGIEGIEVILYDSLGNIAVRDTTDASGNYSFSTVEDSIDANTKYEIRIPTNQTDLDGLEITDTGEGTTSTDNDGTSGGGGSYITSGFLTTPSTNNGTDNDIDFGFKYEGSIVGNVFNDNDGLNDNTVDGPGIDDPDGDQLYANLVDNSGDVVLSVPVESDGSYEFPSVAPGDYTVEVSTNQGTVGQTAPAIALPTNWAQTGENNGTGSGNDGSIDGTSATVTVTSTDITNINFAINKRPESAVSLLEDVVDKGGFDSHDVSSNLFKTSTGTTGNEDTEDYDGGEVESIKVTTFPTNTNVFTVNGTKYTNGGICPPSQTCTSWPGTLTIPTTNGTPDWEIEVDPIDNDETSTITFVSMDDADLEDLSQGKVDITFINNNTVATDDDNSTFVNIAIGGDVTTNDFDPEGDDQTFGSFLNQNGNGTTISTGAIVSGVDTAGNAVTNAGTLTFTASGTYFYTPATDFIGEVAVPYSICDDGNPQACDTALLVIEVEPEEDPTNPNFNNIFANDDDAYSYGDAITANALNNDGDPEQDSFYLTSFKYDNNGDGNPTVSGTLNSSTTIGGVDNLGNSVTNAGTFKIDKYGEYTFTPTSGFEGNVTIEYEICDSVSGANKACEVANINIIVYESNGTANDPPFAGDDFAYTTKNQPVIANWIQNDYDVNSDDIKINQQPTNLDKSNLASDTSGGAISTLATDSGGVVRFYANGTYKYTPPRDHIGPDQVRYEICDETSVLPNPLCDSATIYFVVSGIVRDYGDLPLTSGIAWNVFKDSNNDGIPEGETPIWLGEFVSDDDSTLYNATATGDSDDGLMMPAQLDSTKDNTFRVIVNSTKSNVTVYFTLYFDWDKDGSFEASYSGSGLTGSPDTVDVDVAYPGGDGSFNSRLRVSLDPNDIQPTGQMMNGETEDYVGNLTPVPVELLYFSSRAEGEVSYLEWETASELNNSHFEIERKTPRSDWEYIGREEGYGTTQRIQHYSHIDYNPYPGVNYYRLRQVDFDGAYEYSNIELVSFGVTHNIAVYPNPAASSVNIRIPRLHRSSKLQIMNSHGQTIYSRDLLRADSNESLDIDISEFASGIYFMRVYTGQSASEADVIKFIKY